MRILQVARQFHPKIGGIESCVLNLSRGLIERGHHVEVVTLDRDLKTRRLLDSSAQIDSIPIHRIPYFGPGRYPIALSWLRFIDDFDVIHVHAIDFFVDSAALGKSFGLQRKPFVVTTHGGIFHTSAWLPLKKLYWRNVLRHSLSAAAAVIAGPDENGTAERLRRAAAVLDLQSRVRAVGELPLSELAPLVASAHLFVSAAPHEGFGITTVEALSAGVPVLVTRTGIHDQIVQPGINGWFWSGLPDENAVATLRRALLLPDARLDEMQLAARKSATPFDWKLTTERYERVFESAHRKSVG